MCKQKEEDKKGPEKYYQLYELWGKESLPRVNTQLRCKYGSNLKGKRGLEDERQNMKGENNFLA